MSLSKKTMVNLRDIELASPMPPDFKTHLNYVSYMNNISKDLKVELNFNIDSKAPFTKSALLKKIRLVELIRESIDEEYKKAIKEKEFAKVCSMWIPVKSYYLIFNLLLILCVLINNEKGNLDYPHAKAISNFRNMIKSKKLLFNKNNLNLVLSCQEAIDFTSKSGDSLRDNLDDDKRARSVLKKLCKYKFDDFCRYAGLREFRDLDSKKQKSKFFKDSEISLFEFFYWYRIKTNYRDLSFLDKEIYAGDIIKFYEGYYFLTINFHDALKKLINDISKIRLGEYILK